MKKKPAPAAPVVRFCGCDDEPLPSKSGDPVYLKAKGILTLNPKEAAPGFAAPVGVIDPSHRFKLNHDAETALSSLD